MRKINKSYRELSRLKTFDERFQYLYLGGTVGAETFGHDRWANQKFYTSEEWRRFRREIIIRDEGWDLGVEGYFPGNYIIIHHINPITYEDFLKDSSCMMDPNNVIATSPHTHRAIHYGVNNKLSTTPVTRTKNDTCPWKKN